MPHVLVHMHCPERKPYMLYTVGVSTPILATEETLCTACCGCWVTHDFSRCSSSYVIHCGCERTHAICDSYGKKEGVQGTPTTYGQVYLLKCLCGNHRCGHPHNILSLSRTAKVKDRLSWIQQVFHCIKKKCWKKLTISEPEQHELVHWILFKQFIVCCCWTCATEHPSWKSDITFANSIPSVSCVAMYTVNTQTLIQWHTHRDSGVDPCKL